MQESGRRLVKSSQQWTPEQVAWLDQQAKRLGLGSRAAAARFVIQQAMHAEYRDSRADVDVEDGG